MDTLPKFHSSSEKHLPNRQVVFQPPFSRGYVKLWGCVLGIVRILIIIKSNCWKSATVASIEIFLPGSDSDERIGGTKACDDPRDRAAQIIETSHNLISKGSWGREITFFQANLGWWNSLIWPDRVSFCSILELPGFNLQQTVQFFLASNLSIAAWKRMKHTSQKFHIYPI